MSTITDRLRRIAAGPARAGDRVQAVWNGTVLAESDRTVLVEANHYFPREDINAQFLAPSSRSTVCPWKGTASYYDVVVNGQRNTGAAWYYPKPSPAAAQIKDGVAFWRGVKVARVAQT
jgi:uncharacterized protein (DUF427 family)